MLSSYCRNCGAPATTTEELSANWCGKCEEARAAAIQTAKTEDPKKSQDDLLYAGRIALMQRAHHPRNGFISPRDHNRFGAK